MPHYSDPILYHVPDYEELDHATRRLQQNFHMHVSNYTPPGYKELYDSLTTDVLEKLYKQKLAEKTGIGVTKEISQKRLDQLASLVQVRNLLGPPASEGPLSESERTRHRILLGAVICRYKMVLESDGVCATTMTLEKILNIAPRNGLDSFTIFACCQAFWQHLEQEGVITQYQYINKKRGRYFQCLEKYTNAAYKSSDAIRQELTLISTIQSFERILRQHELLVRPVLESLSKEFYADYLEKQFLGYETIFACLEKKHQHLSLPLRQYLANLLSGRYKQPITDPDAFFNAMWQERQLYNSHYALLCAYFVILQDSLHLNTPLIRCLKESIGLRPGELISAGILFQAFQAFSRFFENGVVNFNDLRAEPWGSVKGFYNAARRKFGSPQPMGMISLPAGTSLEWRERSAMPSSSSDLSLQQYAVPDYPQLRTRTDGLLEDYYLHYTQYTPPDLKLLFDSIDKLLPLYNQKVAEKEGLGRSKKPDPTRVKQINCLMEIANDLKQLCDAPSPQQLSPIMAHHILLGALISRLKMVLASDGQCGITMAIEEILLIASKNQLDPAAIYLFCSAFFNYLEENRNYEKFSYIKANYRSQNSRIKGYMDEASGALPPNKKPVSIKQDLPTIYFLQSVNQILANYDSMVQALFDKLGQNLYPIYQQEKNLTAEQIAAGLEQLTLPAPPPVKALMNDELTSDQPPAHFKNAQQLVGWMKSWQGAVSRYALFSAYLLVLKDAITQDTPLVSSLKCALVYLNGTPIMPQDMEIAFTAFSKYFDFKLNMSNLKVGDIWGNIDRMYAELVKSLQTLPATGLNSVPENMELVLRSNSAPQVGSSNSFFPPVGASGRFGRGYEISQPSTSYSG